MSSILLFTQSDMYYTYFDAHVPRLPNKYHSEIFTNRKAHIP